MLKIGNILGIFHSKYSMDTFLESYLCRETESQRKPARRTFGGSQSRHALLSSHTAGNLPVPSIATGIVLLPCQLYSLVCLIHLDSVTTSRPQQWGVAPVVQAAGSPSVWRREDWLWGPGSTTVKQTPTSPLVSSICISPWRLHQVCCGNCTEWNGEKLGRECRDQEGLWHFHHQVLLGMKEWHPHNLD